VQQLFVNNGYTSSLS